MPQSPTHDFSVLSQQTDLLFGLMHVGPMLLRHFITSCHADICEIKSLIGGLKPSQDSQAVLDSCARILHRIKGSAALFDLTLYVDETHEFETELMKLRESGKHPDRRNLSGIARRIDHLEKELEQTQALLEPLVWFKNAVGNNVSNTRAFLTGTAFMIEEYCRIRKIHAALKCMHFDLEVVPASVYQFVVDILTQLIRNAIAHGIEPPDIRRAAGKPEKGSIYLYTQHTAERFRFTVLDDGAGINIDRVKRKLIDGKQISTKDGDRMSADELVTKLFVAGVSTASETSAGAGRGVGLDLVLQRVDSLNGHLAFRYTRGKGCQFDLGFSADL